MSRCVLLLNRASGGNQRGLDPAEICRTVEETFQRAGHEISSFPVPPDALEKELARIIATAPDIILIAGGDGTVSAAARQLGGTSIAMGILPLGTFNLAARDLGIPLEIDAAAQFLTTADIFSIDVLDVSGHSCLCTTILGFYPEFAGLFERRDHGGYWWKKTIQLLKGLRSSFTSARSIKLSWDGDGGKGTARTKFSAFVPGRYKDTAGLIPERTDFCSGQLTGYIGTHRTPAAAMRGMLDFALGRQERNPEVSVIKASHMTLTAKRRRGCKTMLDGEILQLRFPITLSILPLHLRVLGNMGILEEPTSP